MAMSKKAYFFSITVLLLIGIAALIMSGARDPGYQREATLANQRLTELQAFMEGIEHDAQTAARVATHRALITANNITQLEGAMADPEATIAQLIATGSYQGNEQPLLADESLEDWTANLQPLAHHLRLALAITVNDVAVTQEDPWHVTTIMNLTITALDDYTDSAWNHTLIAKVATPITGLADPLYTVKTDGRYTQHIRQTALPPDPAAIVTGHEYVASTHAPRYLDRFAGSTASDTHGISSLVDVDAVAAVNVQGTGSIIDWQYFGTAVATTCSLPSLPAWAVIDPARASDYGASCP